MGRSGSYVQGNTGVTYNPSSYVFDTEDNIHNQDN